MATAEIGGMTLGRFRRSNLTENDIRSIRGSSQTNKALALQYRVSIVTIWSIRNFRTWKHVKMNWPAEHDAMLRELRPRAELTQTEIAQAINARHGTEYTHRHISRRSAELGLPKRQVHAPQQRASQWWRND